MKIIAIIITMIFGLFNNSLANNMQTAHEFKFNSIDGNIIDLNNYKDQVILIVNVASRCGFTNQYEDLQTLWEKYKNKDLVVIGVPTNNFKQEPGSNNEIKDFCESTFGITFPMTEKINVLGKNSDPFYKWAKDSFGTAAIPKWNFHKIIINKKGNIIDTFSSITKPSSSRFEKIIEKEIKN